MRVVVAVGAAIVAVLEFIVGDQFIAVLGACVAGIALFVAIHRQRRMRATNEAHADWDAVELELRRARRHGRSLTLHRIVAPDLPPAEARRAIAPALRTTDICVTSGDEIYVAMPEVDDTAADDAAQRLCQRIGAHGATCTIVSATFPIDALTVHALRAQTQAARSRRTTR